MTDFPPPAGLDGYESRDWHEAGYSRECAAEEARLLDASDAAARASEQARDESLRDAWFALLLEEAEGPCEQG